MLKKALFVVAALAIAIGAISATRTSQTNQNLNQQVRALQTSVKKLQHRVGDLEDFINNCETVFPIGRFGDSTSNNDFGYEYFENGSEFLTTGLDYEEQEFDPNFDKWFTTVDPSCVDTSDSRAVPRGRAIDR
jgi:hypothetical protein